MLVLLILICSVILLAGFVFWGGINGDMWAFRYGITIFAVCCFVFGVSAIVVGTTAQDTVNNLQNDYATLTLYYETINHTSNEYVRFDYYKNVSDFNELYSYCIACYDSVWIGALYPDDGLRGISPIEFNLVGDEYLLENVK